MLLKIASGLMLFLSADVSASPDSLLFISQEPEIEIFGRPREQKPSKSTISTEWNDDSGLILRWDNRMGVETHSAPEEAEEFPDNRHNGNLF